MQWCNLSRLKGKLVILCEMNKTSSAPPIILIPAINPLLFELTKNLLVENASLFEIFTLQQARQGAGELQPPNNLLKFVDFVSEKGCKSQGRKNEDSNSYIFAKATRIYPECNIF